VAGHRPGRGRRLDDPADFVRLEIETALQQGKPVFPVLVEGARMPGASELPTSVAPIKASNAIEIADRHFTSDMRRLLAAMRSVRAPTGAVAPQPNLASGINIAAVSDSPPPPRAMRILQISPANWPSARVQSAPGVAVILRDAVRPALGDLPSTSTR
jgi:hypothetical protein